MIRYPENVTHWEEWQQEYRFGLVLIFPPDPVFFIVNDLRAKYDARSQSYCDAHISLSVPVPKPMTEDDWDELVEIASTIEPFKIQYGKLKDFPPHPGVVFSIEPQSGIDRMREKIESASIFTNSTPRKYPFQAHMTIAEFISLEDTARILKELEEKTPTGAFWCDHLVYIVPDENMHFEIAAKLPLGTTKVKG